MPAGRAALLGAAIGWLGACAVATGELAVLAVRTAGFRWGGPLPPDLLAASFGELLLSQTVVWVPATALAAALHARLARSAAGPAPFAAALVVAGAGLGSALAHGLVERHLGRLELVAAVAIVLVAARGAFWLAARAAARPAWGARLLGGALLLALALSAAGTLALLGSPLVDPGAIRPPHPATTPATPAARARAGPHVLWIVLDTARADRTSLHGYARPTTPFLAGLGQRAHVFDTAIADGTWTSPSHASMFTGLPVRAHGMGRTAVQLAPRFETVAETLARQGFRTAAFSNNPLIGPGTGLARGFQTARVPSRLAALGRPAVEIVLHRLGARPLLPFWDRDQGAAITNHLLRAWLDEAAGSGAPLFLFVNYMEAHLPWEIPERHRRELLDEVASARSRALRHRVYGDLEHALNQRVAREGAGFVDPADREVLRGLYDATIRYLDERVAELIGEFEARGLLADTLVIVTSDHGEYLGTHDLWSHLYRTYEDLTRVVLLVREPGGAQGTRTSTPVQLSDLHPTVLRQALGRAGGADPARDLVAVARQGGAPRVAVSEAGPFGARSGTAADTFRAPDTERGRALARAERSIRDERFKYVEPDGARAELYDLATDPGESHDVLERHGAEARRLAGELRRFEQAFPEHRPSAADLAPGSDLRRALRELGYVEE